MIGFKRAMEMTVLNQVVTAPQALRRSLVTVIRPAAEVLAAGRDWARSRSRKDPGGRCTRRLLRAAPAHTFREQLAEEARSIARLVGTPESAVLVDRFAHR